MGASQLPAVPAYPHPKKITQPDGSTITIVGHGDEFRNYITTTDGYTVIKDSEGIYRYAITDRNGALVPSSVKAADVAERTEAELNFLYNVPKHQCGAMNATAQKMKAAAPKSDAPIFKSFGRKATASKVIPGLENYRGLVILVNFTDRKFLRSNSREIFNDKMNKDNMTYYDDALYNCRFPVTGSVRDYFNDNSHGKFKPTFDVVGPIEVDVSSTWIKQTERTFELCQKVLKAADSQVDYSKYDADGDGEVDMFYIIYAGYASSYDGNNTNYVWPHAGDFKDMEINMSLDGKRMGRFACSTEIYGWQSDGDKYLDGIGVIVHEFSHVLGFCDHYDVSGYMNEDPGTWDIMAAGNYNGQLNSTPAGYNAYEKYSAGFLTPTVADAKKDDNRVMSLKALSDSPEALMIRSTQDSVFFMVENRQLKKWDSALPGHGMLVWRVDSCDKIYWDYNALNTSDKPKFRLVRADGVHADFWRNIEDGQFDAFPGSTKNSCVTNFTRRSHLLSNKLYPASMGITEITESDGLVNFTLVTDGKANPKPYTFTPEPEIKAHAILDDGTNAPIEWTINTATVIVNNTYVNRVYNFAPDTKNLAGANPGIFPEGLYVPYQVSSSREQILIEANRVGIVGDQGIWLCDFNNLEKGGSGVIVLNMSPFGDISLADPDSRIGYCTMARKDLVVKESKIIERFSVVKNIEFGNTSGIIDLDNDNCNEAEGDGFIYNLQGIRITNPAPGQIYIKNGRKFRY